MLSTSRKGIIAELRAAGWLMEQGFEVFLNIAPDGPADLACLHRETGDMFVVDVKSRNGPQGKGRTEEQKDLRVRILYVGEEIEWSPANDNHKDGGC